MSKDMPYGECSEKREGCVKVAHRDATRAHGAPICIKCHDVVAHEKYVAENARLEALAKQNIGVEPRSSFWDGEKKKFIERDHYVCLRCKGKIGWDPVPHGWNDCFLHALERLTDLERRMDDHNL